MPAASHSKPWEIGFRGAAKVAPGWTVSPHRGKIRLQVRRAGQPAEGLVLPLEWSQSSVNPALQLIGRIYRLVAANQETLRGALAITLGQSDTMAPATDWAAIAASLREALQNGRNEILEQTWRSNYAPYIEEALRQLSGPKPPLDGHELLRRTLVRWSGKPPSRAACCIALRNLTDHAVARHHQPSCWQISPASIKELRGRPAQKRTKATLEDQELLDLIKAIEARNPEWANVLRLLTLYGLRPVELQHLGAKLDEGGILRLWCSYRKTCGAQQTEPRWLMACPLKDRLDNLVEWNLAGALAAGLLEMPRGTDGGLAILNGHYVEKYLARQPEWRELRDRCEARGEWLRPYAFRDSYSLRCHRFGVEVGAVAMAMGHSLAVHSSSYRWASQATTAAAFEKALSGV
jgi:integrase